MTREEMRQRSETSDPRLTVGNRTYAWIDGWAELPDTPTRRAAFPHSAIVISDSQELLLFDTADRQVVTLDRDGKVLNAVPVDIEEAHGMTVVVQDGFTYLWLADASVGRRPDSGYSRNPDSRTSKVVKAGLDGNIVLTLPRPPIPVYIEGHYRPTSVAVHEQRFGGNGEVWVADGYGESYVHHFDGDGNYLDSLSGEEGAGGRFDTPHALYIDHRRNEPELYIADRANSRIQVYGMDGRFRRSIEGFFHRPTWIARDKDFLVVVEFTPPRLTILDADDRLVGYIAESPVILDRPGWPNVLDAQGQPRRPALEPTIFNSPHCVAVDADGNFYVTEFLIGGRITKLQLLNG